MTHHTYKPRHKPLGFLVHLDFKATDNMAEYEALIFRLSVALSLGVWELLVKYDSQLIIKHVKGECSFNDPSWLPTNSMSRSWKRILRSWTCTTFLTQTM
jgi:ribonuclease HI